MLVSVVAMFQFAGSARAISPPKGISLSPFSQEVKLQQGDVEKSFSLTITNHTTVIQELSLSTKDFGSLNDTGGIILEGTKNYSQKYGLASWLTLERDTVTLQPEESTTVLATIDNRASLQPGGHYGAIVATIGSLDPTPNNHVVINQQLLSLVLVDKIGGEHYDLKLVSAHQNGNWLHLPNDVTLRFQNPGNVHVIPRGIVKLISPGGRVVAQGIINDESAYLLPETFREMHVNLTPVGKGLPLPGTYHVQVQYRYDGLQHFGTKNFTSVFINLKGNLILLLVLIVAVWRVRKYSAQKSSKKTAKTK